MTETNRRFSSNHLAIALAATALGLAAWPYIPGSPSASDIRGPIPAAFETITAERINIVDPDGTLRLAIANQAHQPAVIYRGETYPKRSIEGMAGIIFYEEDGNEAGGIALARLRDSRQSAFIFDYTHQLTDGIGMIKRESEDGSGWKSGFFISDRRPFEPGSVKSSQGVERIWLSNENKTASLVISDHEGRPRIRIAVDDAGEPSIEMFDAAGVPTFSAEHKSD